MPYLIIQLPVTVLAEKDRPMVLQLKSLDVWISRMSICKDFLNRACALHNLLFPKICAEECTRTPLLTPKTLETCKQSTPCLTQKASRCAADRTSKKTTFFIFHFL